MDDSTCVVCSGAAECRPLLTNGDTCCKQDTYCRGCLYQLTYERREPVCVIPHTPEGGYRANPPFVGYKMGGAHGGESFVFSQDNSKVWCRICRATHASDKLQMIVCECQSCAAQPVFSRWGIHRACAEDLGLQQLHPFLCANARVFILNLDSTDEQDPHHPQTGRPPVSATVLHVLYTTNPEKHSQPAAPSSCEELIPRLVNWGTTEYKRPARTLYRMIYNEGMKDLGVEHMIRTFGLYKPGAYSDDVPVVYRFDETEGYRDDLSNSVLKRLVRNTVVPELEAYMSQFEEGSADQLKCSEWIDVIQSDADMAPICDRLRHRLAIDAELVSYYAECKLDTRPYLIGGVGGVLDLRDKTIRSYRYDDFVSLSVGYQIKLVQDCPEYCLNTLKEALFQLAGKDPVVYETNLMLASTALDGNVQKFIPFTVGPSNSGKSFKYELLKHAMGEYNARVSDDFLGTCTNTQNRRDIMALQNRRCVVLAESQMDKCHFDTQKLQRLTGGDDITVSGHTLTPSHQIYCASNTFADPTVMDTSLQNRCVIELARSVFVSGDSVDEDNYRFPTKMAYDQQGSCRSLKDVIHGPFSFTLGGIVVEWRVSYMALLIQAYSSERRLSFPECLPPLYKSWHYTWRNGAFKRDVGTYDDLRGNYAKYLQPNRGFATAYDGVETTCLRFANLSYELKQILTPDEFSQKKIMRRPQFYNWTAETNPKDVELAIGVALCSHRCDASTDNRDTIIAANYRLWCYLSGVHDTVQQRATEEAEDQRREYLQARKRRTQTEFEEGGVCENCNEKQYGRDETGWTAKMGTLCRRCYRYYHDHGVMWSASVRRGAKARRV